MAQITVSITKRTVFRDSTQEFSNVYTYGRVGAQVGLSDAAELEGILDELVVLEKGWHSTGVTFVRGRVWSSGGSQAANQMIIDKALSGTGSSSVDSTLDKERAVLIMWRAGTDSRGRSVYLRKWYHSCGNFGAWTFSAAQKGEQVALSATHREGMATMVDSATRVGVAEGWGLIADSGRERDGGPPTAHKFLEHHQLGDQWRTG